MHLGRGRFQLLEELQVVQHVETAAEGGEHDGVLLGLDLDVVHAHRRQVETQRLPQLAAIETEIRRRARPGEQQIGLVRVLPHALDVLALRQPGGDLRPVLAVVGGLVHVRVEVVPVISTR